MRKPLPPCALKLPQPTLDRRANMKNQYDAYLFDLDGTLVDSAPDICAALNYSLQQASLPVVSLNLVRHWIGHGSRTLVHQALLHQQLRPEDQLIDKLLGPFLSYYREHIADHSQLYPNTMETLLALKQRGARLAIVTNKLTELSLPLLTALNLEANFDLIVCGDTTAHPKPAPDPIQHVLDFFNDWRFRCGRRCSPGGPYRCGVHARWLQPRYGCSHPEPGQGHRRHQ